MGTSAAHREKWAEIVRRYRAGEPMDDIAERMGVDPKTVYNVARRAGLPNRHRFDPERTTRILAKYQAGRLIEKIAESEKVHPTFVRHAAAPVYPRDRNGVVAIHSRGNAAFWS
jgi:Helix-turn-helix domain of resolvase